MIALIKRWFAPPVFEGDEEKTRLAAYINASIIGALLLPVLAILGNIFSGNLSPLTLTLDTVGIVIGLYFRRRLRQGQVLQVGLILMILGFAFLTMIIASLGTIRTPTTTVYLLLVILAGSIFKVRGIVISTIACSLAILGLILAESAGLLPSPDYSVTIIQWLIYTGIFAIVGSAAFMGNQVIEQSLSQARREIEERKRAENILREKEERYRNISNLISDYVFAFQIKNGVPVREWTTGAFEQITGYSPDNPIVKNGLKNIVHPEDMDIWQAREKRLKNGEVDLSEFRIIHKNGSVRWLSTFGYGVDKEKSGSATHKYGAVKDITERRMVEEALRKSEELIRSINNNLVSGMIFQTVRTLDGKRKFTYLSDSVNWMYGVTPQQGITNPDLIMKQIHEEDVVHLQQQEEESYRLLSVVNNIEIRRIQPDGNIYWSSLTAKPVRMGDGTTCWNGIELDITERKRTEVNLNLATAQLSLQLAEIEQLQDSLREQAIRDPLTGLFNRRYLSETIHREIARARREHSPLSIVVVDVDHFKEINDVYGHQIGDLFLMELARFFEKSTRSSDIVCRYGGEEFLFVLPGTSKTSAYERAEEIRKKCMSLKVKHESHELWVTISVGTATYPEDGLDAEEIIIKADKALYRSKQNGRNQVTLWSEA